ncbi:MAG: protein kinase [Planctomycetes bacterium]|nr:protein kinase [Planctomycetota bacterium]
MSPNEFDVCKEEFVELLELSAPDRARRLAEIAAESAERAAELERWLALHTAAAGFLDAPAHPRATWDASRGSTFTPGTRLGRFRVLTIVGVGGSGVVFAVEQEAPKRRVALKLLLHGSRSDAAVRRFLAEAQVLAELDHPSIARVHECGTLELDGRETPYLALELVEGARDLMRFADERVLDLDARLALFASVCAAVAHGHRRGVVHRDLKPQNVLIDADGRVKVIDFGIARLAGDEGRRTLTGEWLGTLAYMSPEQCADPRAADERSDVYALGAMLYELVTGALPHATAGRSLTEIADAIRETAPTPPRALATHVSRDLEAIVMRALEKEPSRRYADADELCSDLARLRRGEPVAARGVGARWRLRTFVYRHRRALSVAAGLCLLGASTFAVIAWRGARTAASERARSERVTAFLCSVLQSTAPSGRPSGERAFADVLADASARVAAELADVPEARAEVHAVLADAWRELGDGERAVHELDQMLALRRELDEPGDPELLCVLHQLALCLTASGRPNDALRVLGEATAIQNAHPELSAFLRGITSNRAAEARLALGDFDGAEQAARRARELYVAEFGAEHESLAAVLKTLASIASARGAWDDAEAHLRSAATILARAKGEDALETAVARARLASVLERLGRDAEAVSFARGANAVLANALPVDHPDRAAAEAVLAAAR